uniref:Uncharacterized protein n=4 Tax=Enterobacteriaceae TaxID=543 RepID=A0A2S0T0B6_ECOLX|nr:hypothetical protein pHNSHP45-2-orf00189 [Escherichia coli]AOR06034.1 hypothetical protein [Salmonella enterica subsp. enterica serovar Indiana]AXJ99053.1 hypothetical protein [Salmonella enterica subsp. enterica serovar Typhimurium]QAX88687.1 hypothetical protein [Klebsiella pneumoniae]AWB15288.1 hypothetical protein [Escherichia coli]
MKQPCISAKAERVCTDFGRSDDIRLSHPITADRVINPD